MPALNFSAQFADDVQSGAKCQTIRAPRKRPIRVGDVVHLFTGQRTKACRKLGMGKVTSVAEIIIGDGPGRRDVWISNEKKAWWLSIGEIHKLARADGFDCKQSMSAWFGKTHGLPFHGVLIQWRLRLERRPSLCPAAARG